MICFMHYALTASTTVTADASIALAAHLIPAHMLGFAVVAAVLLVMGNGFWLCNRFALAHGIG
jgi:NO-binding membrane sensor protein with MHYT domain